jgi:hypothetical protein
MRSFNKELHIHTAAHTTAYLAEPILTPVHFPVLVLVR